MFDAMCPYMGEINGNPCFPAKGRTRLPPAPPRFNVECEVSFGSVFSERCAKDLPILNQGEGGKEKTWAY